MHGSHDQLSAAPREHDHTRDLGIAADALRRYGAIRAAGHGLEILRARAHDERLPDRPFLGE